MPQDSFKRKLTAILSADVEGYSRLMEDDEAATVKTLTAYREVITSLIQQHNGLVLDSPGDNLLAEFASVVDAVQCAVAVQKEIKTRNEEFLENRKMRFRIGINLGDVIQEEERIYGDGVNIAARLEGLAQPEGICISKTAFDHIESKLPYGYEFLGDQTVKNISKPVGAYRVLMEPRVTVAGKSEEKSAPVKRRPIYIGAVAVLVLAVVAGIWYLFVSPTHPTFETAAEEKMAFPLPAIPSIAVLPFVNMNDDPEQEDFSDGITEDIITDLSNFLGLFVISRSSTFAYKGKTPKIKQVAEELGVRYVVEGSVRKSDDKVRINTQLIDAITGRHLWAERYDRDWKDIFALQDEITQKIVLSLDVEVTEAEFERVRRIPTQNLNAYESVMRGWAFFRDFKHSSNLQARQMFEQAIQLDPDFAAAYLGLGWTHLNDWFYWKTDPQVIEKAFDLAQKARSLDDSFASAYRLLAFVILWKDRQHEQAISAAEKAISLQPNNPYGYSALAEILKFAGRPEEVIELLEKAMRLNPRYPSTYLFQSGSSYYYMGRYNKALEILKRAVIHRPNHQPIHLYLTAIYTELGRKKEAQAELAEVLRISPNYSLKDLERGPYKDPAYLDRLYGHMRKAGLK